MTLFQELTARGMIAQCTDPETVAKLLDGGNPVTFYIGFDPTADSLHIGHYIQLMAMARLQQAGHRPIAIFGGGTAMIGDPSGKNDMRKMLTPDEISHNISRFKTQMAKFIDTTDEKALFIDNGDWLLNLNYVDMIREAGPHFTINRMLAAECYKSRMDTGLTFLEFNYMIMQSYDFFVLNRDHGCILECGGDDQWSNIIGGVELIRRKTGREVYGLTFKLLLTADGIKMGKTESGALWLDPEKTAPYDFFQYLRNVGDADVINCMKMLTFMPLEEIAEYEGLDGAELNRAKEKLAFEVTRQVHGDDAAGNALEAAKNLFSGGGLSDNMPTTELDSLGGDFTGGTIGIIDLLCKGGLSPSRGEAKRLIAQGGVFAGEDKITADRVFNQEDFAGGLVIRKGKKTFHKFVLK